MTNVTSFNQLQQRKASGPRVLSVRPMVPADLESLRQPSAAVRVKKLREAHHVIARYLASGMAQNEIALAVGYNATRISILANDPAMAELVAKYRDLDTEKWLATRDEFHTAATANMLKAERMLSDKLDDAIDSNEFLPVRDLVAITADRADRFGYGKKQTNLNVNVDFASRLEEARRRIDRDRAIDLAPEAP